MRISTSQIYRRGVKWMNDHQSGLAKAQEQISSGRKILKPSDDPTGSARLMELHKQIQLNNQYERNITIADGRQGVAENAIQASSDILQRARELTVEANNAALNGENRQMIALEVGQLRQQLLDIANTKDGDGAYLFAGFREQTLPFTVDAGEVIYNGDQGQRLLQVGPSRQVAIGDPGDAVFMNIRKGNEQLQTLAGAKNTGDGTINTGSIIDPAAFQNDFMGHEYRIEFTNDGATTKFSVIEVTNGVDNSIPLQSNQSYVDGQPISFRGMQVIINGAPDHGDDFTVSAAQNISMFKVLDNLVSALETPSKTPLEQELLTRSLANALTDIDQGLQNLSQVQGRIGSRMNALDAQDDVNQNFNLQLQKLQSDIGTVDYAEAASNLNQELLALQASQQSFVKIQNLSLFNYLQ